MNPTVLYSRPESGLASSGSSQSGGSNGTAQEGQESKLTKKSGVPIVPFGMDLYYWDNPKDVEPMTLAP